MRSRRRFVVSATSASVTTALLRFAAGAAEYTYKLGHDDPTALPASIRLAQAAAKIQEDSGGRFEIQVFPNDQLGSARDQLAQVRLGAIQLNAQGYGPLGAIAPAYGIDYLPYVYGGVRDAFEARDGAFGAYLRGQLAKAGLYAFERSWELGFRQMPNNVRPINTPDDLRGLKIRTSSVATEIAFLRALGASPAAVAITEVYPGLQTHLIDGAEIALEPMYRRKFFEVVKYLPLTYHGAEGIVLLANGAAWDRLPKTLRDIAERNFNAAALASRDDILRDEAATLVTLKSSGMIDNRPDIGSFKSAIRRAGLYATWRDAFGADAWSALEKSVGPLA